MSPKPPPAPEDSPPPPRHRAITSDFSKDALESDLWAFDDIDPLPGNMTEPEPEVREADIPPPQNKKKPTVRELIDSTPVKKLGGPEHLQVNVRRNLSANPKVAPVTPSTSVGSDFDDLDHWDEPVSEPFEKDVASIPAPALAPAAAVVPPAKKTTAQSTAQFPAQSPARANDKDEFSPIPQENATPISLRPHLGLSKTERIGLVTLAGLLIISAIVISISTLKRLPTEPAQVKATDFPIKGKLVTILSADSYWRAPIMEGKNIDTFRRGTQLLPVVDMKISGGPAAIRVFFRNSDREVVGDTVSRTVQTGTNVQVAATAGFEDIGMHAAYRTGRSKPWTIEVYEAPAENSPGQDFKKLFEMTISTNRR